MEKDCIFCKIIAGEVPCKKVIESQNFIVIEDANQQTPGHSLLITKEHYETFLDVPKAFYQEMMEEAKKTIEKLTEKGFGESFNIVTNIGEHSGRLVAHYHLHLIPRTKDDGFKLGI